ncbi:MAG TPA: hypothetical protein VIP77_12025 [Jiangellaceae bacterium]
MTALDAAPTAWAVGQETSYTVGLVGKITEIGESTITIDGVSLPTRLTVDGPVKYLSIDLPTDPTLDEPDHGECVSDEDYALVERQLDRALLGVEVLHNEHHDGVFRQCLHEVCRQLRGAL